MVVIMVSTEMRPVRGLSRFDEASQIVYMLISVYDSCWSDGWHPLPAVNTRRELSVPDYY